MKIHPWLFTIVACLTSVCFSLAPLSQETQDWIGDRDDGSRAMPVHNIPLLDEEGMELLPDDEFPVPFSVKQTCGKCHQYERITQGWHFSAAIESASPGRPGHPWIYVDHDTGTVLPLSYREWQGAFTPKEAGLNDWQFIKRFGRHWPGGGVGEWQSLDAQDLVMRKFVSGPLDANCLACHDANPAHDQAEYANQIARENFRWAAASTSSFAIVSGAAADMPDAYDYLMPEPPNDPKLIEPGVEYKQGIFDAKKRVFFDIKKQIPNERCYYCHTSVDLDALPASGYNREQDVHIAAGMSCVDCHTNGVDHDIVRGYPGESVVSNNPLAGALTCEGCHIQHNGASTPTAGRFTAPLPEHKGIPPVHFDKLACTACHSGPWPDERAHRFKTSLAHGLGMHKINHDPDALPHIYAPVFAKGFDGKIAPHYALWPSYWTTYNRDNDETYLLTLDQIKSHVGDLDNKFREQVQDRWGNIDNQLITNVFDSIRVENSETNTWPNLISGSRKYSLTDTPPKLFTGNQSEPYLWPMGHDVRPAAQSLGVRGCDDCHSQGAAFFTGALPVDGPYVDESYSEIQMIALMQIDQPYTHLFNQSFGMRPLYKCIISVCAVIIALIGLAYIVRLIQRAMDRTNTILDDELED
ncbi:MAG: hypothetical protein P9L94_04060 [Candidatus Hinthialibacter antarcticus]|nr:hypothetical protein [Candidatus Hinthialibacter antarcticus]